MRNFKKGASLAFYGLTPLFDSLNTALVNTSNSLLGSIAPIFASLGGGTTAGMGTAGGAGAGYNGGYYYKLITDLLGL